MSDPTDFETAVDLSHLTPDDDEAPQLRLRRSAGESELTEDDFNNLPDHDDGPEVLAELIAADRGTRRSTLPPVKWAKDSDHPDYAHLIGAEDDGVGPGKSFKVTAEVFELLIEANYFRPDGPGGKIVFGLRGGLLANGKRQVADVKSIEILDTRPNHKQFRCTIGYYDRTTKRITAYLASTVPNVKFMENYYRIVNKKNPRSKTRSNLLPTGCYAFHIGTHGGGRVSPALRMIDPDMTVLRTSNDLTYKMDDYWHRCQPYDNIHCAYTMTSFSSAGCQTICGGKFSGPWGEFRKELKKRKFGTPYSYLLLTGREAGIAAKILETSPPNKDELIDKYLRCLRLGSYGPAVRDMQIGLGFTGKTQFFGPGTRVKLVEFQRNKGLNSDAIYTTADDAAFGWKAFKATAEGTGQPTGPAEPSGPAEPTGPAEPSGPTEPTDQTGGGQKPVPRGLLPETLVLFSGPQDSMVLEGGKKLEVPGEGTWSVGPQPGKITFAPVDGFHGAASPVSYQISNAAGATATAQVSVTVLKVNKAPVVEDDAVRIVEGEPVSITVLANDVDADGTLDPTSVKLVSAPTGSQITSDGKLLTVPNCGTWTVDAKTGVIGFAPIAGFTGLTRTTYEVSDDGGATARGHVSVTVEAKPEPLTAAPDVATTDAGQSVVIDVLSNDAAGTIQMPGGVVVPGPLEPSGPQEPGPPVTTPTSPTTPTTKPATRPAGGDEVVMSGGIPITEEQLRRFVPKAKEKYVRAIIDHGPQELAKHGINVNPMRLCHFMAQISHESGGFTIDTESLYYTSGARIRQVWPSRFSSVSYASQYTRNEKKLATKVYDGRVKNLGNTEPGDGYRYRGRGLIQTTGRGGYRTLGRKIGVDLEGNPELATDGHVALKVAAQTWTDRTRSGSTMNQLADANKIKTITLRINGGYTNLAHRRQEFERAWAIWGTGSPPRAITNSDLIERGDKGEQVKVVQRLLVAKGYFPQNEKIDGKFGGKTMQAVARFQYTHNKTASGPQTLNVNGIVDKKTLQAMKDAPDAVRRSRKKIPRNARDPRQLESPHGRRAPGRHHDVGRSPDRWPGIFQLAGLLLLLAAIALPIIGTVEKVDIEGSDRNLFKYVPWTNLFVASGILALLSALCLGYGFMRGRDIRRAGGRPLAVDETPAFNPLAVERGVDVDSGSDMDVETEPATPHPLAEDEPPVLGADAPLHEFGFSPSDFDDPEPIRSAVGLAADVDADLEGLDEEPSFPELAPEDDLEEPGAPDKRNDFRPQVTGTAARFNVSSPEAQLVLIKMFGGDNNLSHQVANDLDEIAAGIRNGPGNTAVIALADLENAPASIVEITTSGKRNIISNLGEIDTGDPDTLATFVSRALATYPHARKAVGFWDHGTGVFDELDEDEKLLTRNFKPRESRRARPARKLLIPASQREELNANPTTRGMLHDSTGGILTNVEAGRMLRAAFSRSGQVEPLDMIYSDTCLNGMIEVLEELGDYAHCVVASSDTEPGAGWDYEDWIGATGREFPATPVDWGKSAVRAFSERYRNDVEQHPCTLAAFHSDNQISEAFAVMIDAAQNTTPSLTGWFMLTHARSYTQSYDRRDAFDLIDFAQRLHLIAKDPAPNLAAAAADLDRACREARVDYAAHGSMVRSSKGLAFWFPSSRRNMEKDMPTYRKLRFAQETGWADYLEDQFTGATS
ncbi:MAG: peptidoglycan-binding protein [Alphaproteobacteria bacterium]|nr:peptidoglycan-binding protein [Alphaproteobacteria bacterium]